MSLPKQINNQSGQVLVIFLLVLVIGLALVLSIASRTVTDIRQTTTSDESNRAYYAAESGVEDALKKISAGGVISSNPYKVDLSAVNNSSSTVKVEDYPSTNNAGQIVDFLTYNKDDVAQIALMRDFGDLGSAGNGSSIFPGDQMTFYFGTSTNVAELPALEISFVSKGSPWTIRKMIFDPYDTRASDHNMCHAGTVASNTSADGVHYTASVTVTLNVIDPPCTAGNNEKANDNLVLARVRFLYFGSPLGVSLTAKDLPKQGYLINSTGSTPSGVSRKLVNKRFYSALPGIFDYVLYNGSTNQDLCKGSTC